MKQQTLSDIIEDEVAAAIEIAEEEIGHDLLDSYLNASPAKQEKAEVILRVIRAIYDTDDEEDKARDIFANVLKLETVLGLC